MQNYLRHDSFFPSTIILWNSLDSDTKASPSLATFKRNIYKSLEKPPSYCYCGTRPGQVHHVRPRTESSSLNHHLFKHNLVDNPDCNCGMGRETVKHFLLDCSRYIIARSQLFQQIPPTIQPTVNNMLFGCPSATMEENETLFNAV